VKAPMQATIVKLAVADGDVVVKGDLILVLEAMKMEQPITAHKDGTITGIAAADAASRPYAMESSTCPDDTVVPTAAAGRDRMPRAAARRRTRVPAYFSPEKANPSMTRRCSTTKRMSTGAMAMRLAAIITG
jgi:hypothetical protein